MRELRGKTALITGASRGIGARLAHALAKKGMNLVLAARSLDALEKTRAEVEALGVRAVALAIDVGDSAALPEFAARAQHAFGSIDVLINNAGLDQLANYAQVSPATIDQMIRVNLTAPMVLTRLFLPEMIARGEGHIVNVSSLAGLAGTAYNETYSATKHALIGFTRSLRLTIASERYPIGASVICPGFISDTGMFQSMIDDTGAVAPSALGTSSPEDVTNAVLHAIAHDTPERIVSSLPVRPLLLIALLWPRLGERLSKAIGVVDMFKHVAERRDEFVRAGVIHDSLAPRPAGLSQPAAKNGKHSVRS